MAPAVWGSTYVVTTTLLPDGRPLLAGVLRALPAGLLLLAVTRSLPSGGWWWRSAVLGTLNIGAFFALLFVSAYRLPGGVAAVLGAAGPLLVLGLAAVLLDERTTRRAVGSAVVAAGGVALTVLTAAARLDAWGLAAGLAGAGSMALGIVLTRRWGRPAPALTTTGWQLTAGGLVLLPLALLVEGPPPALSPSAVGGYAYLSLVGSALAYTLWFRGLDRLPAASVSLLGQLSPVVAAALGWAVLQERLTSVQLLGMALAVGGVVAGQPRRSSVPSRGGDRQPSGSWNTGVSGPPPPAGRNGATLSPCGARPPRGSSSTAATTGGSLRDSASSSLLSASLSSGRSRGLPSPSPGTGSGGSAASRSG